MSWSVNIIGTPQKVVEELVAHSARLTGQCKVEFDDALPHLSGLVQENFNARDGVEAPMVRLEACGSGCSQTVEQVTKQLDRSCTVRLERFYAKLV